MSIQRSLKTGTKKAPQMFLSLFRYVILIGLIFYILYPFIFMLVSAFRDQSDLLDPSVVWITRRFTLKNFSEFLKLVDFNDILGRTALISLCSAFFQTFVCGLTGYGFARFNFKGKKILFALLIFTMIVPPQTYILQLFLLFRLFPVPFFGGLLEKLTGSSTVNMINTPLPFLFQAALGMGLRSGLFIYIYRQFFRSLPKELENAARIDGSNAFHTYFRIMLPNALPSMVTVAMLSMVWNWNDAFSQSFLSMSKSTIATFLSSIRVSITAGSMQFENPAYLYVLMQTGMLLCITPLVFLFLFGQKFFIESVDKTGLVG